MHALGLETPRLNVLGSLGKADGPTLVLNAHLDTVPVTGVWSADPFGGELRDGCVWGRGAADSKGRLAGYTYALVALARAGARLRGRAVVAATADEETGGELGVKYLLSRGLLEADAAIVEGQSWAIWIAANGCLHLRVTVEGRPAHAAVPERGVDAVEVMHGVLTALYAERDRLRARRSTVSGLEHSTLVVGTIDGGAKTNVVADRAEITIDRRILPDEDPDLVLRELQEVVARAVRKAEGAAVATEVAMLARPYGPTPPTAGVVRALLRRGEQVLGEVPATTGIAGFTDARFFWEAGIPTVNYGPGPRDHWSSNAHGGDEHLRVDDLLLATKVLALTVLDLAGASDEAAT